MATSVNVSAEPPKQRVLEESCFATLLPKEHTERYGRVSLFTRS
jgi:hypothetical protein